MCYYQDAYGTPERRKALHEQTYPLDIDPEKEIARRQKEYIDALEAPKTLTAAMVLDRLNRTGLDNSLYREGVDHGDNLNFACVPNQEQLGLITQAGLTVTDINQDLSAFHSDFTGTVVTGCVITKT